MTDAFNNPTKEEGYTERLVAKSSAWWKRWLDVQRPYRWHLKRLHPGYTLDLGCGIGRNLAFLDGVGVDHNERSVAVCRSRGLTAFSPQAFAPSRWNTPGSFDSILLAHVAEHMTAGAVVSLLQVYLPVLKSGGRVIIITPQEAGYRSDPTHVQYMDFGAVGQICDRAGLAVIKKYSFPFPRFMGNFFKYNEFVIVAQKR